MNPLPGREKTGNQLRLGTRRKAIPAGIKQRLRATAAQDPKGITDHSSVGKTEQLKISIKAKQTEQRRKQD